VANGLIPFFSKSNESGKDWTRRELDENRFQLTKVGRKCDVCSKKEERDIFKSIRVQYCKFKTKTGDEKIEFEWLNTKCHCVTVIIYKNGHVVFNPASWYSKAVRIFDDLKNIPSSIEVYIKD